MLVFQFPPGFILRHLCSCPHSSIDNPPFPIHSILWLTIDRRQLARILNATSEWSDSFQHELVPDIGYAAQNKPKGTDLLLG